uniref:Regulator of chromosome condensation protein n=1 Tax=Pithovirus LCPAC202 TaxID=2506592 RepID=A0A481Z5D9_9VIRU|nr:MAG: regulator of chromosome condensation protein [Pithovirus LCPAC202]
MEPSLNLSDLPPETITELLYNIKDLKTLANLCQTNKRIHAICENEMFWKEKYRRHFRHLPSEVNLPWKEQYKLAYTVPISPISAGYGSHSIIDNENMLYMGGRDSILYGFHEYDEQSSSGNIIKLAKLSPFQQKVRSVSHASSYVGAVTDDGKVYFWGENLGDILGESMVPIPKEFKIPGKAIKISCGPKIGIYSAAFAVILEDRSVFLRMNYFVHSELYHLEMGNLRTMLNIIIGKDDATKNIKALDISINGNSLAIVSTDGKLYYLGKLLNSLGIYNLNNSMDVGVIYKDGQIVVNPVHIYLPETIKQVSLADDYIGVLSTKGNIYLWGSNRYGQLGQGRELEMAENVDGPLKLTFPVPISFLTCNYYATAAIEENGKLYIWGRNTISAKSSITTDSYKYANLGDVYINANLYRTSGFNRPIEIGLLHNNTNTESKFNYVAIGGSHIVATTNDGYVNIWSSGDN